MLYAISDAIVPALEEFGGKKPRRRSDPGTAGAFVSHSPWRCSSYDLDHRYLDQRQLQNRDSELVSGGSGDRGCTGIAADVRANTDRFLECIGRLRPSHPPPSPSSTAPL